MAAAFADEEKPEQEEEDLGLLKKRARTQEEEQAFENEYKKFLETQADRKHDRDVQKRGNEITGQMLQDFWLNQDGLDENERFLREFVEFFLWFGAENILCRGV